MSETCSDHDHESPVERDAGSDASVMACLLCEEWAYPWTVDEIAREMQKPLAVTDSVGRLVRAGLLHHRGEFVWPTRTARYAARLDIGLA